MTGTTTPRTLRADAQRNRERVIDAARKTFAERGVEAQMEDIARIAGVGVGTIYRQFPTKDALIEAVAAARFTELAERAEAAFAEDDPWESLAGFLRFGAALQARDRCFAELVSANPYPTAAEEGARLRSLSRRLVQRAQKAGAVRSDFDPDDIPVIMCGLGHTMRFQPDAKAWERYIDMILDGMRAR